MKSYISLLRGINVSGQKKMLMTDLVQMYVNLGLVNPAHYIQSGNISFQSENKDERALESLISENIQTKFGFHVPVQVWKKSDLIKIYKHNPFLSSKDVDIRFLHLSLLSEIPNNDLIDKILEKDYSPDRFQISERAIYLYCPNNYGRTKLTNTFFESKLKIQATTRNWKTIGRLVNIMEENYLSS